nr:peroxidase 60-like [Tanacetum cinerariifolium]
MLRADIIIMATRDVVSLSGGGRYKVQTGRRDGLVSLAQNTISLPPPTASVATANQLFALKGLTTTDMIYLLGGHSIGIAHCSLFKDRLYNFKNTGKPDPTMDSALLSSLRKTCAQNATIDRTANLDQNPYSSAVVDNSFYSQIIKRRGVLKFDQDVASDRLRRPHMTQKKMKGMENRKVICLGGKNIILGQVGGSREKRRKRTSDSRKPNDIVLMSTAGHLRNGGLDVKDLLKSSKDRCSSSRSRFGVGFFNDGLGGGYNSRWSVLQEIVIFPAVDAELLVAQEHAKKFGFYKGKCQAADVEDIVRRTVYSKFLRDRSITPALIRMQFHDCFVSGCDASILLDGPNSEKTAPPNLSVRGFDVIDAAKDAVEKVCPGVVSCADIIIMATRDVVSLSGGGRYKVQTGRRDGLVSLAQNTISLPPPTASVVTANQLFALKGLTTTDMIYLSDLASDNLSKSTVARIARSSNFNTKFGQAMVKLGAVQVLTGQQGQIRKSCRAQFLISLCVAMSFTGLVHASDPDILFDYIVPPNVTEVDGKFFTCTKIRGFFDESNSTDTKSMLASMTQFPALNGQSVSLSLLRLAPGGVSAPHTRPHATGLFFVLGGTFEVGFVDTTNKHYTQTLQTGDMFIFPKGLVHYQYNSDMKNPAVAVAAFGSASAPTVLIPTTLFDTDIDDVILAKSFKTNVATIRKLKAGVGSKS